jgi:uncharacterized oligopeptide transporter (OPT) family protein
MDVDCPSIPALSHDARSVRPALQGGELTLRAVVAGCVLGALLAAANVYTGLTVAFLDGGSITASVLVYAVFARARRPYSALETNLTQTIAASAAIMSMVTGVAGPVPALILSGHTLSAWVLVAWGVTLGMLGVLVALFLRPSLISAEALPFPTGTATAEVIAAMACARDTALRRGRVLLAGASISAALTVLRDAAHGILPHEWVLFAWFGGAFTLSVATSPLLVATGALLGLRVGASMLLGALLAWGLIAPWLVSAGVVPSTEHQAVMEYLMWPATTLILSSALTATFARWRPLARGLRDVGKLLAGRLPADASRGHLRLLALALFGLSSAMLLLVAWVGFGLGPGTTLIALLLSCTLACVCARAAGETDIAPVGDMGGLTQMLFGALGPVTSLTCGSIVAGQASQTAQTLWALKAGERLGASVPRQVIAQMLGVLLGALVVVPTYAVVTHAYELGSERLPAPSAISWKVTAEAVRGGFHHLPQYGPSAVVIALIAGIGLTLLSSTRAARYLPSPVGLGIAFLMPASISATVFVGTLLLAVCAWLFRSWSEEHIATLAGGMIAGESLSAVVLAALVSFGLAWW